MESYEETGDENNGCDTNDIECDIANLLGQQSLFHHYSFIVLVGIKAVRTYPAERSIKAGVRDLVYNLLGARLFHDIRHVSFTGIVTQLSADLVDVPAGFLFYIVLWVVQDFSHQLGLFRMHHHFRKRITVVGYPKIT